MRDFPVAVVIALLLSVSGVSHAANLPSGGDIILVDQIGDTLAHESDRDLVNDYILAYSIDFDGRIQDELKSDQITASQARAMKEQFHAAGTGFADQMEEMFETENFSKALPFDERVRIFLRKSIRTMWEGKELKP